MASRGWGGSITTALGVAAGAGAAQLGFGYGLGIINWAPPPAGTAAAAAWTASLIWATWIPATSTVLGAVCAQRLRERGPAEPDSGTRGPDVVGTHATPDAVGGPAGPASGAAGAPAGGTGTSADDRSGAAGAVEARAARGAAGGTLGCIALAVAAGLGAVITVLLVAVPARVAVVPDVSAPRNVAAVYAALGVLVGVAVAVWALHSRAAATNVIATVGWLWLLAVVAVVDGVLAGRGLTSAQLGIWQISAGGERLWIRDWFYWPGAVLSLGSALVIGILAARRAARDADRRVGATASGAAGPLLVALAYLLAVPGLTAIGPEQVSAHVIAPYAVVVGLGGSVLVATLHQRAGGRTAVRVPRQHTAPGSVAGPAGAATGSDGAATGSTGGTAALGTAGSAPGDRDRTTAARTAAKKGTITDRLPAQRAGEGDGVDTRGPATAGAEPDTTDIAGTADIISTADEAPASGRRARPPRRDR